MEHQDRYPGNSDSWCVWLDFKRGTEYDTLDSKNPLATAPAATSTAQQQQLGSDAALSATKQITDSKGENKAEGVDALKAGSLDFQGHYMQFTGHGITRDAEVTS